MRICIFPFIKLWYKMIFVDVLVMDPPPLRLLPPGYCRLGWVCVLCVCMRERESLSCCTSMSWLCVCVFVCVFVRVYVSVCVFPLSGNRIYAPSPPFPLSHSDYWSDLLPTIQSTNTPNPHDRRAVRVCVYKIYTYTHTHIFVYHFLICPS